MNAAPLRHRDNVGARLDPARRDAACRTACDRDERVIRPALRETSRGHEAVLRNNLRDDIEHERGPRVAGKSGEVDGGYAEDPPADSYARVALRGAEYDRN